MSAAPDEGADHDGERMRYQPLALRSLDTDPAACLPPEVFTQVLIKLEGALPGAPLCGSAYLRSWCLC